MAERPNGADHSVMEIAENVTLSNGRGEFARTVTHRVRPVVGNLAVIPETKIASATFEFMVEHGEIEPEAVKSASYDTGTVLVRWTEPRVVELDAQSATFREPKGQVRPRLVEAVQRNFPTIITEWSDNERIARFNNHKYRQPSDGQLAMAVIAGTKPL